MKKSGDFDYIIAGAGAVGCVLANRLTADPNVSVLLLEADNDEKWIWTQIPVGYLYCIKNPRTDWCFKSKAEPGLNGRSIIYARGKDRDRNENEAQTPEQRRLGMTWAQRLKREFSIDVSSCPKYGGEANGALPPPPDLLPAARACQSWTGLHSATMPFQAGFHYWLATSKKRVAG